MDLKLPDIRFTFKKERDIELKLANESDYEKNKHLLHLFFDNGFDLFDLYEGTITYLLYDDNIEVMYIAAEIIPIYDFKRMCSFERFLNYARKFSFDKNDIPSVCYLLFQRIVDKSIKTGNGDDAVFYLEYLLQTQQEDSLENFGKFNSVKKEMLMKEELTCINNSHYEKMIKTLFS